MTKRRPSSGRWLQEHFSDPYVKKAQKEGYRSRAAYKLLEIQERSRIFKPGMVVVDLGAAPGGWCQVLRQFILPKGRVVAMDLLAMDPIEDVDFFQQDFTDDAALQQLDELIGESKVDWVISDMAPNMSGQKSVDIPRSMYLAELALDFALRVLPEGGGFLTKVFQGEGFDEFFAALKKEFDSVAVRKPKASRDRSREVYVLAQGRRK